MRLSRHFLPILNCKNGEPETVSLAAALQRLGFAA
jgi:hypothetical protein